MDMQMKVQVLIATMNQTDHSLLEKMNIHSDVIVGNQCDRNEVEEFDYNSHRVKWLSFSERGVGLNRNNCLMRADNEIVLFADDDLVYYDDYEKTICEYYEKHPKADVVVFNFKMRRGSGEFYDRVKKSGRLNRWNATRYGTYCITARTESIRLANIHFHLLFGGGAKYSCGEDTIFLNECIRKKLRVYACDSTIGMLDHGESTWFKGYSDKFFYDKGALFAIISPKVAYFTAIYHCVKHRKKYAEYGIKNAISQMYKGISFVKKNR